MIRRLVVFIAAGFCLNVRADLVDADVGKTSKNLLKPEKLSLETPLVSPKRENKNSTDSISKKKDGERETEPRSPDHLENSKTHPQKIKTERVQVSEGRAVSHEPIHFEGEGFSGYRSNGVIELTNKVKISQGDMVLDADRAKVYFDVKSDDIRTVIASGHVHLTRKELATGQHLDATSDIAEFDAISQIVTLKGRARLVRGGDTIVGSVIQYNLATGWVEAEKVQGVVKPQDQEEIKP